MLQAFCTHVSYAPSRISAAADLR